MGSNGRDVQRQAGPAPGGDAVYGLGMIGAWVYYWQRADTTGDRVIGILKGLVWPAFLVYEAFSAVGRGARASSEERPESARAADPDLTVWP